MPLSWPAIQVVRLQHDRHVVKPGKRPDGFAGFSRDHRQGPNAVGYFGELGLDLEHRNGSVRSFQCALLFDLHHGGNSRAAPHRHSGDSHRFIADGHRIEM
jgi:hypothetical protein